MRYYKQIENDKLIAVGTTSSDLISATEITKEEYENLLTEIRTKAELVDKLYDAEITISDIPTEWQEEIERRVAKRIASEEAMADEEISSEEFYDMVEGVL